MQTSGWTVTISKQFFFAAKLKFTTIHVQKCPSRSSHLGSSKFDLAKSFHNGSSWEMIAFQRSFFSAIIFQRNDRFQMIAFSTTVAIRGVFAQAGKIVSLFFLCINLQPPANCAPLIFNRPRAALATVSDARRH